MTDGFDSDLGLGDDDEDDDNSSFDEGISTSEAGGECLSDDVLLDDDCRERMRSAILFDQKSYSKCERKMLHPPNVDDSATVTGKSAASLSLDRRHEKAVDDNSTKRLPELLALSGQETCWVCDLLCVDNRGSGRDAIHYVCAGGRYRTILDPRESRAPSRFDLARRGRTLEYVCRYLHRPINDVKSIDVRIYYPYFFYSRNEESGALFDILQPSEVTAFHLVRASRMLVPCPHLQYHFEQFWKLFLPEFTTLRTGMECIPDVPWYYVQMVACKTRYPHVQSYGCAYDTWIEVNEFDWRAFVDAIWKHVMVGVSGECQSHGRMMAIESLTAGTFLGGNKVFFPTRKLRDVFHRKFEPFLPPNAHTHVGEQESDGSPSCPHGENHRVRTYYFLV